MRHVFNKEMRRRTAAISVLALLGASAMIAADRQVFAEEAPQAQRPVVHVAKCDDFQVTGGGDSPQWERVQWVEMNRRPAGELDYQARFKMCYSKTGLYVLFDGTDKILTATITEDFRDLWHEDVYECFFWTDERHPVYFEYEISPLGYELPILIPNLDGKFRGWRPWHYEGRRRTRKAVVAIGGERKQKAKISGWRAEVFIPFDLLEPLQNVPPKPGTRWRANFYRVDHDQGRVTGWDWARVGQSFHDYHNFGVVVFE